MTSTAQRHGLTVLTRVTVAAIAYAGIAAATLVLSRDVGLAAPLWPAAGVAFALTFQWGRSTAVGIAIASFGVNSTMLLLGDADAGTALGTASLVGLGAALQALAGSELVRRVVGSHPALTRGSQILAFLLLAGPVASLINPSIGVLAELANGVIAWEQGGISWLTWWVGDVAGVVVFAPITMMLLSQQEDVWRGRRLRVAGPSLVATALLLGAFVQSQSVEEERIHLEAQRISAMAVRDLQDAVTRHSEVLEGIRGLMVSSESVDAQEFQDFTERALARFPNLQAISWNPVIPAADRAGFEQLQRQQQGMADYRVTERDSGGQLVPVAPRPDYVAVGFIEPVASNRPALGFDIQSDPIRARAIAIARDTGLVTSTAPITLVQETGSQPGMLTLLPVYGPDDDPTTVERRRAELIGFAVGVYRLGDLVDDTFSDASWDSVDVRVTDLGLRGSTEIAHHQVAASEHAGSGHLDDKPTIVQEIPVNGRLWSIEVTPTAIEERSNTVALLVGGLLILLLLEAFLLVVTGMERQARREADRSSYEANHDALTDLLNRRAFTRALRAARQRSDLEGTEHVLMYMDLDGFKQVNDTGGHEAGDELLRRVARELARHVRGRDVVARVGGDEFAIILHNCGLDRGRAIAADISTGIDGLHVTGRGHDLSVGVSIGLALIGPGDPAGPAELVDRADQASYRAKRAGAAGNIQVFSPA